jgi:hypothetical protein
LPVDPAVEHDERVCRNLTARGAAGAGLSGR